MTIYAETSAILRWLFAEDVFPLEPVRALDAIHLASALFLRESFSDLTILTTDERVRSNATLLGFSAEVPSST